MITFQFKFLYKIYKNKIYNKHNISFNRDFNFDYKDIKYLKNLKKSRNLYKIIFINGSQKLRYKYSVLFLKKIIGYFLTQHIKINCKV